MKRKKNINDAFVLESCDIRGLSKSNPEKKIGVNVSSIYVQIAKFSNNPLRSEEICLLKKSLKGISDDKHVDARYVFMQVEDVMKCFDKSLKKLPKSTFLQLEKK